MSRNKIIEYSQHEHDDAIAVVSISDPYRENPYLLNNPRNGILYLLQLQFTDADIGQTDCITDKQANEVAGFVNDVKDKVNRIIVHCQAGVSRSAGVAAAIMKYVNGNDWDVFDNAKYRPNMTCYRKVLDAFTNTEDCFSVN
jgi:protein-tyrosine phosphatase